MRGVCLSREAWLSVGETFFFFLERGSVWVADPVLICLTPIKHDWKCLDGPISTLIRDYGLPPFPCPFSPTATIPAFRGAATCLRLVWKDECVTEECLE